MNKKILIINGPNINLLGEREQSQYGKSTLNDIKNECVKLSEEFNDKIEFFQNIREGYLRLSEEFSESFLVLDAEKSLEENLMKVCNWLGIDKA